MEKIREIIRSNTFYNTGVVSAATAVNGILGFVFYFLLARFFDPETLGIITIAITTASLITDIAAVGTETGVVNFVGRYLNKDREKALRFLKLAFEVKVVISLGVILVGWFLVPSISTGLFGKSNLIEPLRISLLVAASLLLFGFATSTLQSLQKFYQWGFINIFSNAFRLLFTSLFFFLGILTVSSGLFVYLIIPFLAFLITFLFLPNFFKTKNEKQVLSEFFHYNKWVAIFTLIAAISSRLDMFLIVRFLSLKDVGIYSVAATLTSIIPQFVGVVGTVVAPKLAGMANKKDTIKYLKKVQLFVSFLALIGVILGSIVGYVFINKFYSADYHASFVPYLVLLVSQAIFLLSIPVHMAITYYFSYPKFFVYVSIVNITFVFGLGFIFINNFGFIGAAIAVLVGNIINFVLPLVWVVKRFQRQ